MLRAIRQFLPYLLLGPFGVFIYVVTQGWTPNLTAKEQERMYGKRAS